MTRKNITNILERYSFGVGYPEINKENDLPNCVFHFPEVSESGKVVDKIGSYVSTAKSVSSKAREKRKHITNVSESIIF